ncbi:hypothetical protein IB238_16765 [Rhizobium sp. ARZ01]|uniref:hypothetical protein n=1 Tax=Rhizobium sp. ARZ01 TaxID=2769313 RepID=UPI001783C866|nr:hypothetical protein [Rhizobium sp. ARZ01]MBD9374275.1 hypothetical protein [Rhizobium sp. ARZ01]
MANDKETGENGRRASIGVVRGSDKKASKTDTDVPERTPVEEQDAEAAKAAIVEQIALLKEEVARLKASLGVLAESSGQYAVSQVNSLRDDVRAAVVANPLSAVLCASLVGYLFGLRRR